MQCKLVGKLFEVVNAIISSEKVPRDYGTGHLLYHSELHFIEIVSRNPETNAIALSEIMNVTRGAVTQTSNKLEKKGVIERYSKPDNKKEKYYRLTELGNTLRKAHLKHHADANGQMCEYLRSLNDAEKEVIVQFLDRVSDAMPICVFDCTHQDGDRAC